MNINDQHKLALKAWGLLRLTQRIDREVSELQRRLLFNQKMQTDAQSRERIVSLEVDMDNIKSGMEYAVARRSDLQSEQNTAFAMLAYHRVPYYSTLIEAIFLVAGSNRVSKYAHTMSCANKTVVKYVNARNPYHYNPKPRDLILRLDRFNMGHFSCYVIVPSECSDAHVRRVGLSSNGLRIDYRDFI